MMRAWGNRPDTFVVDEPFYAHYLDVTKADHPAAAEVIASGETDSSKVIGRLLGDIPAAKTIFYQKQMTHHLLPKISRAWLPNLTNCFLIRDPREVITSYLKKNHEPSLEDLGFVEQAEIFDLVHTQTGAVPPVIDARDVLENPRQILLRLCARIGVEFSEAMLSWPAGRRETDGVWAKHWYAEVERSTSFGPYKAKAEEVPEQLAGVYQGCLEVYQRLRQYCLH